MAATKASKKKRAPEDEGRGKIKRRKVGEPSKVPSTPIVEAASSKSSWNEGVRGLAPEATVMQGVPEATLEIREEVPPVIAPTEPTPKARGVPSPRVPTGPGHGPRIRSSDKDKGATDPAHGSMRRAPSGSSRSSGDRSAPGIGQGALDEGFLRAFHSRLRGKNWDMKALMKGDDSVL